MYLDCMSTIVAAYMWHEAIRIESGIWFLPNLYKANELRDEITAKRRMEWRRKYEAYLYSVLQSSPEGR